MTAKELLITRIDHTCREIYRCRQMADPNCLLCEYEDIIVGLMQEYAGEWLNDFTYCQRDIEGNSKCKSQCGHCKEYYKPLENKA